ncbi:tetratricopeptide repeat protein [Kordiimonas pumila]|uniref:Tetratricopeptide repeat protein n=1 Tax=Kordiimonas pumila TaxID=2161677 RepID=A0ABV7D2T9_9PROT|nr:hypothetical protein [Kordiimonas pumila]
MATARKRKTQQKAAAPKKKTKLEKLGFQDVDMSIKELRQSLNKGIKYAEAEDWENALPPLLKAWDAMPDDIGVLTLIAQGLSRLGVREYAIKVLERALSQHEPTIDLCTIMQTLALDMGMYEVASKLGLQLIAMEPNAPRHYVNLATAYTGMNAFDESIEMLQAILPVFPDTADLWNVLATQVRARDGAAAADVFFDEALRLNPDDFKVISNYAQSFTARLEYDKALAMNLRAVEVNPSNPEPRMGVAQISFMKGDMKTGWENYKHRLSPRRKITQTQIYTHGLEEWQGENLEGKAVLVAAEQGIGDEVMFGNYLPYLYERAAKLAIGCDRRLVSIYQRRFPDAIVSAYVDQIKAGYRYRTFPFIQGPMQKGELHMDYAIPLASAPMYDWLTKDDVKCHPDTFLVADPVRAADFKSRLQALGDKPKVGLAWRSGLMAADRVGIYAGIDELAPLFAYKDQVDFVNLQYGDCTHELLEMKERYGVTVHNFEDVNLKADIEANLAIMENCDIMIGACSAPGIFSMSLGRPTMLMHKVPPWYCYGQQNSIPFVKDCHFSSGLQGHDWAEIMEEVRKWMVSRLNLKG